MSNESTYYAISSLVNTIQEGALLAARENSVMSALVRVFSDTDAMNVRKNYAYSGGTIGSIAETTDMSAQTFTPAASQTLTPASYGMQYFLTDARIASDWNQVQADAATDMGQLAGVAIDTNLVGNFANLTGGTVGTAGGTITWANLMLAATKLRAAFAPQPYYFVCRPEHWYYLTNLASGVPTFVQSEAFKDSIAEQYYQGSWGGINFFVDANITSGTAAKAAMFSQDAIALDVRRAARIEAQRDASRGGGGWELNLTVIYAHGIWRPTFGVTCIGTSSV
jgi:hypothetical protein